MTIDLRVLALGTTGVVLAGGAVLALNGPAGAAGAPYAGTPIGTLSLTPTSGTNLSGINYSSSAGCPSSADSYVTRLYGNGLPDTGEVVTSKSSAGFSSTGPISAAFQNTPQSYADKNSTTLTGLYDVVLRCTAGLSNTSLGDFKGQLRFTSPTSYTVVTSATPSPSASATPTASPSASATPTASPSVSPTASPTTQPERIVVRTTPAYAQVKKGATIRLSARVVVGNPARPVASARSVYWTRNAGAAEFRASRNLIANSGGVTASTFSPPVDFRWYVRYVDDNVVRATSATNLVQVR